MTPAQVPPLPAGSLSSDNAGPAGIPFAVYFQQASAATGVPATLLEAVATVESAFDPTAVSVTDAQGLMQLEPATAAAMGVADPWNPAQNILGGARYLADQLATFHGDIPDALAAYNAGPGSVDAAGSVPAAAAAYVADVLQQWAALTHPPSLSAEQGG